MSDPPGKSTSPVASNDEVDAFERSLRAERRYSYGIIAGGLGALTLLGGAAGIIWLSSQSSEYNQGAGRAWGGLIFLTGFGAVLLFSAVRTLIKGETFKSS